MQAAGDNIYISFEIIISETIGRIRSWNSVTICFSQGIAKKQKQYNSTSFAEVAPQVLNSYSNRKMYFIIFRSLF